VKRCSSLITSFGSPHLYRCTWERPGRTFRNIFCYGCFLMFALSNWTSCLECCCHAYELLVENMPLAVGAVKPDDNR